MSKKPKQKEMQCPVCGKDGLIWEGEDNDDGYRARTPPPLEASSLPR